MNHVGGVLTLLPQKYILTNAVFQSTPVILSKQKKIAVGGTNTVYMIGLNPEGRFDGTGESVQIPKTPVKAMTYSEKTNRLYIGVNP